MAQSRGALALAVAALAVAAGTASGQQQPVGPGDFNNEMIAPLVDYHFADNNFLHIDDPSLTPDQQHYAVQELAEELLASNYIPTPLYLLNGLLGRKNAEIMSQVAEVNENEWMDPALGWAVFNKTVPLEDREWFRQWDRNVSAMYAQSIDSAVKWVETAADSWQMVYLKLTHNLTQTQDYIASMSAQYDQVMRRHDTVGTASGGLLNDEKSSGEKFTLAMNIMNFILNLCNLIGLAAFLIIKRKVGPSAVLDTEMTFPSSPTAQI